MHVNLQEGLPDPLGVAKHSFWLRAAVSVHQGVSEGWNLLKRFQHVSRAGEPAGGEGRRVSPPTRNTRGGGRAESVAVAGERKRGGRWFGEKVRIRDLQDDTMISSPCIVRLGRRT